MNQIQIDKRVSNRGLLLNGRSIGVALFYFYIFISSLANDTVFPSTIGSLSLYLFLA